MNVMAASMYDPISNLLKTLEEWKELLHDLNHDLMVSMRRTQEF